MANPEDLFYSAQHLWVRDLGNGVMESGITDYAQDLLGDVVFVEAPKLNSELSAGAACGLVESVKTGSDLHAPLNGTVTELNEAIQGNPELLNDKPYQTWIFRFRAANPNDINTLLSKQAYEALIGA